MKLIRNFFPAIGRNTALGFRAGLSAFIVATAASTNVINAATLINTNQFFPLVRYHGMDTNLFSALNRQNLLVAPFTNLPASDLANPFYFSPALGTDYVRQAVLSFPQSTNVMSVGGGKINVVGINYTPVPIILTNSGGGIMSWELTASTFEGGAIVGTTNPVIRIGIRNCGGQYNIHNLIIASTVNQMTNLIELPGGTFGRGWICDNSIGLWSRMTNNQSSDSAWIGLTPPSGLQDLAGDLNIFLSGGSADKLTMERNSFSGINGVDWEVDHGSFSFNQFTDCGGINGGWSNKPTIYSTGACFYYFQQTHGDLYFKNNFAYHCGNGWFFQGNPNFDTGIIPVLDEGDDFESLGQSGDSPPPAYAYLLGTNTTLFIHDPLNMVQSPNRVESAVGTVSASYVITLTNNTLFADDTLHSTPTYYGSRQYQDNVTVVGTNTAGYFSGNAGGETNVPAASLAGSVTNSINSISGVITNGFTPWYFLKTNGTPAIAAPWGALCTTTNGQLFVRSNNVWLLK